MNDDISMVQNTVGMPLCKRFGADGASQPVSVTVIGVTRRYLNVTAVSTQPVATVAKWKDVVSGNRPIDWGSRDMPSLLSASFGCCWSWIPCFRPSRGMDSHVARGDAAHLN